MTEEVKKTHDPKLAIVGKPTPEAKISWLISKNPRAMGKATHMRFERYFGSTTVAEFLASGGTKGDLLWDIRAGYLAVEGVTVGPAGDKPPRAPRTKKVKADASAPSEDAEAAVATETIE